MEKIDFNCLDHKKAMAAGETVAKEAKDTVMTGKYDIISAKKIGKAKILFLQKKVMLVA